MARTHRATTIDRLEACLARVSEIAEAAGILLARLDCRPDPDPAIAEANMLELLRLLYATRRVQQLLIDARHEV